MLAVFAGREELESVIARNVISVDADRKRTWAGTDRLNTPTKSVRKNRVSVSVGSSTSSLHIIPKNSKTESLCVSLFFPDDSTT